MLRMALALSLSLLTVEPAAAASVDGVEIHSTVAGNGPKTIIFVHGWTCDESSWAGQVPAFDDTYRVVTLDLPGHGKSDAPAPDAFSMDLFAKAVEAVRQEVGADKVVLVGHSMGAVVIREYALDYPEHVAGLVAVDGPLDVRPFRDFPGFGPLTPGFSGLSRHCVSRAVTLSAPECNGARARTPGPAGRSTGCHPGAGSDSSAAAYRRAACHH